jgi:hypothetical protein
VFLSTFAVRRTVERNILVGFFPAEIAAARCSRSSFKPQLPMMYDLSSDPHEDSNLWFTELTNGAFLEPVFRIIGKYERSVEEYPNIKVGEDFKGYKK